MNMHAEAAGLQAERPAVLIVGGGLAGLSTSLFLSWYGIPSLLVERHTGLSPDPRASGFNARTLELFRMVGLEQLIRRCDPSTMQRNNIVRVESLVGQELEYYAQHVPEELESLSPTRYSFIAQHKLERILHAGAVELGARICFHTELVSFEQDAGGVSAVIRNRETGQERVVRAQYLVAADGSKSSIRRQLGIPMHGPGTLAHCISIRFQADLRDVIRGRSMDFCFLNNPEVQGVLGISPRADAGKLVSIYRTGANKALEDFTEQRCIELVRAAVGIPDLAVTLVDMSSWELAAYVAERYRQERIFLVGDAAHVMPPTGALGGNTGIQDAYDLAWKLAYVLNGTAGPDLLTTYEVERRPVAQVTVEQACAHYAEWVSLPLPMNRQVPIIDPKTIVFGYRYHSAAVCLEPQDEEVLREDVGYPSGRPGTRAPHVTLARGDERLSTLDLFAGNFVLLTGPNGARWRDAAKQVAETLQIHLEVYTIDRDLLDVDQHWYATYGVASTGAVLIRPDGFIGWRSCEGNDQPAQTLAQALTAILCRP